MTKKSSKDYSSEDMEKGVQPLDMILTELELKNSALVEASCDQLTFKMVAKGRKGRRLTLNAQMKILTALNACQSQKKFALTNLFNYQGM